VLVLGVAFEYENEYEYEKEYEYRLPSAEP
jgi:hypothetical protein